MRFTINKEIFQEKLVFSSRFSSSKTPTFSGLQGALLKISKNKLEIITTNLDDFFYTQIEIKNEEKKEAVIDLKKIIEFLNFLPSQEIEIELQEKKMIIRSGKTTGCFNLTSSVDFPPLPKVEGKKFFFEKKIFLEKLPLIIFSAAKNETRPVLTGVNFLTKADNQYIVATDGFRLSLFVEEKKEEIPSMIVSALLLEEIIRLIKGEDKKIEVIFSSESKIIRVGFEEGKTFIFSRAIEGEFPPFERVIPTDWKTRMTINREEFLRNIKLISVFARDYSNIVFFEIKKDGLYLKPKTKEQLGTVVFQEGKVEGEEQRIAFNYKFILDFLVNVGGKEIIFEMNQPNTPGVFKTDLYQNFLHIIMPIRIEEETF